MRPFVRLRAVLVLCMMLPIALAACTTMRVTPTARSATEQQLLSRGLERATARLDTTKLAGRRIWVDLVGFTGDQTFAREYVTALLRARGLQVRLDPDNAEIALQIFGTALGVDQNESLLGIPTMQVPVLAIPIPEIALFKWTRNRALAELQTFAYDRATDTIIEPSQVGLGRAKYDHITMLLFISFVISDLHKRPAPAPAPPPR